MATGCEVKISHGLGSCTNDIAVYKPSFPQSNIYFVDTPGFDSDNYSDAEVFKRLAQWLNDT